MKKLLKLFLIGAIYSQVSLANAVMPVSEIIQKAEKAAYYQGEDGVAKVDMQMSDGQSRQFVILRKNFKENQKFFVYFKRPSDVMKTTFLVHKFKEQDDDRWMYLPSLDLVKRIASGDKRTSFVGSNFYYEDVSGRNPSDDEHFLEGEEDGAYIIKSVPKDKDKVEFAYFKTWIDKNTFIPKKAEYFDAAGKNYRRYMAQNIEDKQGFKTVTQSVMEDLNSGEKTNLSYSEVKYNVGLPEDIFTERFLKNPPKKWLE
jgi:outer membrane lipoprotein-sorting protein